MSLLSGRGLGNFHLDQRCLAVKSLLRPFIVTPEHFPFSTVLPPEPTEFPLCDGSLPTRVILLALIKGEDRTWRRHRRNGISPRSSPDGLVSLPRSAEDGKEDFPIKTNNVHQSPLWCHQNRLADECASGSVSSVSIILYDGTNGVPDYIALFLYQAEKFPKIYICREMSAERCGLQRLKRARLLR